MRTALPPALLVPLRAAADPAAIDRQRLSGFEIARTDHLQGKPADAAAV